MYFIHLFDQLQKMGKLYLSLAQYVSPSNYTQSCCPPLKSGAIGELTGITFRYFSACFLPTGFTPSVVIITRFMVPSGL